MTVDSNQEGCPNYFPNSFGGPKDDIRKYNEGNFTQCGIFFRKTLNQAERERLVDNIASHIINAQEFLQERAIKQFGSADAEYGRTLRERIQHYKKAKNGVKETIPASAIAHI